MNSESHEVFVLAIDVGTSSARAALFDGTGQILPDSLARCAYHVRTDENGAAELDPESTARAVDELIDEASRQAGPHPVHAVGISTFWHSLLGIDAAGKPTTPLLTWADTRAAADAADLRARIDHQAFHRRTGAFLHPSYPVAKLAWIRRTAPSAWRRSAQWLSFAEYLCLRWFGETRCSVSMASGTGLFHQRALRWDPETLDVIEVRTEQLSPITDEPFHRLRPDYAGRWPGLASVAWYPAWGDGALNNVGSGAIGSERLALMVGTSGALRLLWRGECPDPPDGLWLYRLDRTRPLLGGALSEGGNLIEWIAREFRLPPPPEIQETLAAMAPGRHGLTWLPFIAGERSPGWAVSARGTLTGIHWHSSGVAVLRAAMEAVACRFALVFRSLQEALPGERLIIGSGNGLASHPAWVQIIADALGRPIVLARDPDASLRGAALMALERSGAVASVEHLAGSAVDGSTLVSPRPEHHAVYEAMMERQQRLYRLLLEHTLLD